MRAHSNIAQETWPSRCAIGPPVADVPAGRCNHTARPLAATPADAAGSTDSAAVAASASMAWRRRGSASSPLENVTRIHSPDVFLAYPAVDAGRFDFAFRKLACLKLCHNAGRGVRHNP